MKGTTRAGPNRARRRPEDSAAGIARTAAATMAYGRARDRKPREEERVSNRIRCDLLGNQRRRSQGRHEKGRPRVTATRNPHLVASNSKITAKTCSPLEPASATESDRHPSRSRDAAPHAREFHGHRGTICRPARVGMWSPEGFAALPERCLSTRFRAVRQVSGPCPRRPVPRSERT